MEVIQGEVGPPMEIATPEVLDGLNTGKIVASDVGATIVGVDAGNLPEFLLEVVWAAAKGQLQVDKFATAVGAVGLGDIKEQLEELLPELLWLVWSQLPPDEAGADLRTNLADLGKLLVSEKLVSKPALQTALFPELQVEMGWIRDIKVFEQKRVKLSTRLFYTQTKYNLMREESEGFSKLLTLLEQFGEATIDDKTFPVVEHELKSLIGYFDLDPTRVWDLILEAWMQQPHNATYLRFVHNFSARVVAQGLGRKFQLAHKEGKGTPKHLCYIAAELLKADCVTLEALLGHLEPSTDDLKALATAAQKAVKETLETMGESKLNTAPSGARTSLVASVPGLPGVTRKKTLAEQLVLDGRAVVSEATSGLSATSQHLALLEGCLLAGAWEVSKRLAGHMRACGINPPEHPPVAEALAGLVGAQIEPLAQALYPRGVAGPSVLDEEEPTTAPASFSEELVEMLQLLGVHISVSQKVWSQFCRLLRHQMRFYNHRADKGDPDAISKLENAESLFLSVALPGMSLVTTSAAAPHEIWAILSLYPYNLRFRFYQEWRAMTKRVPVLQAAANLATIEVKKVQRRLAVTTPGDSSKKESMKPFLRVVGKVTHIGPFSALTELVSQAERFTNLAEPVLDAMKQLTPLAFDVLTFILIDKLATPTTSDGKQRHKMKADGVNLQDWLQATGSFIGSACKRYSQSIGVHIILQYIANQMMDSSIYDLGILREIIKAMAGVETLTDVSETQLEACAGGPILRAEGVYVGLNTKGLQRGSQMLLQALQQGGADGNLVLPLLVLICRNRELVEVNPSAKDIKFIASQYDNCQQSFLQLLEFLRTSLSLDQYAALMPSPVALVSDCGLDATSALTIHRPLLARLRVPAVAGAGAEPAALIGTEDGEIDDPQPMEVDQPATEAGAAEPADSPEQRVWEEQVAVIRQLFDPEHWEVLSPELVLCFWSLTLPDIYFPKARYQQDATLMGQRVMAHQVTLRNEEDAKKKNQMQMQRGYHGGGVEDPEAVPANTIDIPALKKEIVRLEDSQRKLPLEAKAQAAHVEEVTGNLRRLRSLLKQHSSVMSSRSSRYFVETCMIPRLLLSPEDAAFCATFVLRMHELDMPGFLTSWVIGDAVKYLVGYVHIATELEAINVGIFLNAILQFYLRWLLDEKLFLAECNTKVGFRERVKEEQTMSFKLYCELVSRVEYELYNSLNNGLRSGNYVRMRNALLILNKVMKVFPRTQEHATALQSSAFEIAKGGKEKREDILSQANNYYSMLTAEIKRAARFAKPKEQPASKGSPANPSTAKGKAAGTTPEASQARVSSRPPLAPSTAAAKPAKESAAAATSPTAPQRPSANGTAGKGSTSKAEAAEGSSRAKDSKDATAGSKRSREADKVEAEEKPAAAKKARPEAGSEKVGSPLRPDAPEFKPSRGSTRGEEAAEEGERVSKRPRAVAVTDGEPEVKLARKGSSKEAAIPTPASRRSSQSSDQATPAEAGGGRGASGRDRGERSLPKSTARPSKRDPGKEGAGADKEEARVKDVPRSRQSEKERSSAADKDTSKKPEKASGSKKVTGEGEAGADRQANEETARKAALQAFKQHSNPSSPEVKKQKASPSEPATKEVKAEGAAKEAPKASKSSPRKAKEASAKPKEPAAKPKEASKGAGKEAAAKDKETAPKSKEAAPKAKEAEAKPVKEEAAKGRGGGEEEGEAVVQTKSRRATADSRSLVSQALLGLGDGGTRLSRRTRSKAAEAEPGADREPEGGDAFLEPAPKKRGAAAPTLASGKPADDSAEPGVEKNGGDEEKGSRLKGKSSKGSDEKDGKDKKKDKKHKKEKKEKKSKRHREDGADSPERAPSLAPSLRSDDSKRAKKKHKK